MLGGRIRIPTVDGDVELKVPSGSQPGDNVALRGRGIQRLRGSSRGDQIVTLKVELPRFVFYIYTERKKKIKLKCISVTNPYIQ